MAGLFSMFGGGRAQGPGSGSQPRQGGGFGTLLDPSVALPMAAALMGNQGNMQNFAGALGAAGPALQQHQDARKQLAQRNATLEFLRQQSPEMAQAVESGMPVGGAWKAYLKQREAQTPGRASYSKTPVFGTDKDGNPILGTVGDDGSFKKIDTGDFNVSTGFDKIDTGTEFIIKDKRSGQTVGVVPKENYKEAFDKSLGQGEGKNEAEARAAYGSQASKMAGLEEVVGKLDELSEKATYTMAGQGIDFARRQAGLEPREAAIARTEYIAIVDNQVLPLLRDTFGAAFTEKEGAALRATLGDPDKSPKEKQAVLKAFIEQKRRNIEALGTEIGETPAQPNASDDIPLDQLLDMYGG